MKSPLDLMRAWVRKAESDMAATRIALDAGEALDAACFHAQQAAEKYLKAYLVWKGVDFPYVHNLEKLVVLCSEIDPQFRDILDTATSLTPYAVELRYDDDFWPSVETAQKANEAALTVRTFVLARLPADATQVRQGR